MRVWSVPITMAAEAGKSWRPAGSWTRGGGDNRAGVNETVFAAALAVPTGAADGLVGTTYTQAAITADGRPAGTRTLAELDLPVTAGALPDWLELSAFHRSDALYGVLYPSYTAAGQAAASFDVVLETGPLPTVPSDATIVLAEDLPAEQTARIDTFTAFGSYIVIGDSRATANGLEIGVGIEALPSGGGVLARNVLTTVPGAETFWRIDPWFFLSFALMTETGAAGERSIQIDTYIVDGQPDLSYTIPTDADDIDSFVVQFYQQIDAVTFGVVVTTLENNGGLWEPVIRLGEIGESDSDGTFTETSVTAVPLDNPGTQPGFVIGPVSTGAGQARQLLVYYTDGDRALARLFDPVTATLDAPLVVAEGVTSDELGSFAEFGDGRVAMFYTREDAAGDAALETRILDLRDDGLTLTADTAGSTLIGTPQNDTLTGGAGQDLMAGGPGADDFDGKDGADTASFAASDAVLVDLDRGAGWRGHAEGDSFLAVEHLVGSMAGDRLLGANTDNELSGEGGSDVLAGRTGDDLLLGGVGDDLLAGGAGADTLESGAGNDVLTGGAGDDRFVFDAADGNAAMPTIDVVTDLEPGTDVIALRGFSEDILNDNTAVLTLDGNVLIRLDDMQQLLLRGVANLGDLPNGTFDFV